MLELLIALLAAATTAVAVIMQQRHRRHARRLSRHERTENELLLMIKGAYARDAAGRMERAGRQPRMETEFRSQFGEDIWLWNLFRGKLDGFYIECGAFDGYTYSVTYAFESVGWTGLLVEPIPERHAACKTRRPGSRVEHAALSRRGSTGTARFAHLVSDARHYEASSFLPGSVAEKRFKRPPKTPVRYADVPLTTMDALLANHSGPIDFVVLDVEGAELNLLDGFDLDRFKPRVILIEDHSMGEDSTLADYLGGRGYEHICWISYNRLMVRRDEPDLIARARQISQEGPASGARVAAS